jgi:hypothetical protein
MARDLSPAMGGHPSGATMAYTGDSSPRSLGPQGAIIQSGGVPFQPEYCVDLTKNGTPCHSRPVHGHVVCAGHQRSRDKAGRSTTEV